MADPFPVQLSFKGRTVSMEATIASSASELIASAKTVLGIRIAEEDEEEQGHQHDDDQTAL